MMKNDEILEVLDVFQNSLESLADEIMMLFDLTNRMVEVIKKDKLLKE